MALQLRRGTNAQRLAVTPLEGELIVVTDYSAADVSPLWLGDGATVGGIVPITLELDDLTDVTLAELVDKQLLQYDGLTQQWINVSNPVLTGLQAGNITVGIVNDNTIATTTGDLTINSAGGTVTIDDIVSVTGSITNNGILNTNAGSASVYNSSATAINAFGAGTTITIGATTGNTTIRNNLTVSGNLTVNGTTTTVNSTVVTVDDKNIELGSVATPTDLTADGGGITLKGTTDKTILWEDVANWWRSNQHLATDGDLYLNANQSAGNSVIYFGNTSSLTDKHIRWDAANSRFEITGDVATPGDNLYLNSDGNAVPTVIYFKGTEANITYNNTTTFFDISKSISTPSVLTSNVVGVPGSSNDLFNNSGLTTVNIGNGTSTEVNIGNPLAGRTQIKSPELDINGDANITGKLVLNKDQTGTPATSLRSGVEIERGDSVNVQWQWNELNKWWEAAGGANTSENNIWAAGSIIAGGSFGTNGLNIYFNNDDATPNLGDNASITVKRGDNADVSFRWNEGSDRWESTFDGSTYVRLPNQGLDTGDNALFAGVQAGNVRVGITGDNEIDTTTGNLTIDSAGGTVTIDDAVVVTGNLTVDTNTLIVDATNNQVSIAGAATAGFALTVNGAINASLVDLDGRAAFDTGALTTTSAGTYVLNQTTRDSLKMQINVTDNVTGKVQCLEILALRDGTEALFTTYAEMHSAGGPLAYFTADINSGNLRVLCDAGPNNTTFTYVRHSLT